MFKYSKTVTDATGIVQTSGTVTVWVAGTSQSVAATIYSTNAGAAQVNPYALPSTGLVEFYLANQRFDVTVVTGAGTVTTTDLLALDVDELSGDVTIADNLTVEETLTVTTFSPSVVNNGVRVDVSSAATVDLDAAAANYVRITGTTAITAITLTNGRYRDVVFSGILTLTNGASLILPGGANITTAAGDTMRVLGEASGVVRVVDYTTATTIPNQVGQVIGFAYTQDTTSVSTTFTIPDDDTIPQNTEGDEYTQIATTYTPKFSNSLLEIEIFLPLTSNSAADTYFAIFRDNTADAVMACKHDTAASNVGDEIGMKVIVPATAASATTFKLRYGGSAASTSYIGSQGGSALLSTSRKAVMTIKEIKQ